MSQGNTMEQVYADDPKISFYEFQLLLARIALEIVDKEDKELAKDPKACIERFFL